MALLTSMGCGNNSTRRSTAYGRTGLSERIRDAFGEGKGAVGVYVPRIGQHQCHGANMARYQATGLERRRLALCVQQPPRGSSLSRLLTRAARLYHLGCDHLSAPRPSGSNTKRTAENTENAKVSRRFILCALGVLGGEISAACPRVRLGLHHSAYSAALRLAKAASGVPVRLSGARGVGGGGTPPL
jgi:hypothetical protein